MVRCWGFLHENVQCGAGKVARFERVEQGLFVDDASAWRS